jgi:hypothetical protein
LIVLAGKGLPSPTAYSPAADLKAIWVALRK